MSSKLAHPAQPLTVLQREQEERKDAEAIVNALKRNLSNTKEKAAAVDVEIQQYAANIKSLQKEKLQEKSILDNHANKLGPALSNLEKHLKMRTEGVKRAFSYRDYSSS